MNQAKRLKEEAAELKRRAAEYEAQAKKLEREKIEKMKNLEPFDPETTLQKWIEDNLKPSNPPEIKKLLMEAEQKIEEAMNLSEKMKVQFSLPAFYRKYGESYTPYSLASDFESFKEDLEEKFPLKVYREEWEQFEDSQHYLSEDEIFVENGGWWMPSQFC